jgi:hypothetical protein
MSESPLALGWPALRRGLPVTSPESSRDIPARRSPNAWLPFPTMVEQAALFVAFASAIRTPAGGLSLLADMSLSVSSWRYTIRRRFVITFRGSRTDISQVNPAFFSVLPKRWRPFLLPRGRAFGPILRSAWAHLSLAEPLSSELPGFRKDAVKISRNSSAGSRLTAHVCVVVWLSRWLGDVVGGLGGDDMPGRKPFA